MGLNLTDIADTIGGKTESKSSITTTSISAPSKAKPATDYTTYYLVGGLVLLIALIALMFYLFSGDKKKDDKKTE